MKPPADQVKRIDLRPEQLEALLEQIQKRLEPEQYEIVQAVFSMVRLLSQAVEQKGTSIKRLLKMMFGSASEKTRTVLRQALEKAADATSSPQPEPPTPEPTPRPGHGRNGAADYEGARKIKIAHGSLRAGDRCPVCQKGKVYASVTPGVGASSPTAVWAKPSPTCASIGMIRYTDKRFRVGAILKTLASGGGGVKNVS